MSNFPNFGQVFVNPQVTVPSLNIHVKPHFLTTAALAGGSEPPIGTKGGYTPVALPVASAGPSQIIAAASVPRTSFLSIANPTDGKIVYLSGAAGPGAQLPPGFYVYLEIYQGAVWGVSSNGPATVYYLSS